MVNTIMGYIAEFSPAITAVIGIIVSVVVGFKKIKAHNEDTLKEVKDSEQRIVNINLMILEENEKLRNENEELKKSLDQIISRMNHIHTK